MASPPPPSIPTILEVQIGPGVGYTASSTVSSPKTVITVVTDINGKLVFTMYFSTAAGSTAVSALLPDNTGLIFDIPELVGLQINTTTVYAFNTAATYVASQVVFAAANPDSTASRRKLLNGMHPGDDQQDHPGCDDFLDTACTIGCCAQHDLCYATTPGGCHASSWHPTVITSMLLPPIVVPPTGDCALKCNAAVVGCLILKSIPCGAACGSCALLPPACIASVQPSGGQSCYDHACGKFYDCEGGCPTCPIPYLTPSPPDGCCNCLSPCKPPGCGYTCQNGHEVNFRNGEECAAFASDGGALGSVCCTDLSFFAYAFCVVFGQAACGLSCGLCPS